MALSPKQFESTHEMKDYNTGRRTITHDVRVPEVGEHGSHEPSALRAQAIEYATNKWNVNVVAGPHLERDEHGSYYKHVAHFIHEGSPSSLKPVLRRSARDAWGQVIGARQA